MKNASTIIPRVESSADLGTDMPDSPCPDCGKFWGRALDLCLARGHDGRPNPQAAEVSAFREQHGIQCDNVPAATPVHKNRGGSVKIGGNGWKSAENEPGERKAQKPPRIGVGDHFHEIAKSLGIKPKEADGCGCKHTRATLNGYSPQECRDLFGLICDEIRDRTKHYTFAEKLTAATKAVATGLVLDGVINPLDPAPGLLRIAIARAERAEEAACGQ